MILDVTLVELATEVILFTVNVLEAVLVPSVAEMECTPEVDVGTLKEAKNTPTLLLVIVEGVVVITFPSYLIVIGVFGRKLVPVTVTKVPDGPDAGVSVMEACDVISL